MSGDLGAIRRFYVAIRNIRRGRSRIPLAYWAHGRDDLDITQMSVLMTLVEHPDGMSIGDLAAGEQIDAGNASRTTAKLTVSGFVCREPSTADGRSVVVNATPAGIVLGRKLIRRRDRFIGKVLATFNVSEHAQVISILERIDLAFQEFAASMVVQQPSQERARPSSSNVRRSESI